MQKSDWGIVGLSAICFLTQKSADKELTPCPLLLFLFTVILLFKLIGGYTLNRLKRMYKVAR